MTEQDKPTTQSSSSNPVGRPKLFTSVGDLSQKVEEYFDYCDNRIQQVYSAKADGVIEVMNPAPYTMSGLALRLGMDRRSLLNYSKDEQFFPTIKAARDRVEADVEERMNDKQTFTPGLIFNAKNNFKWVDQQEIKSDETVTHKYEELTDEQLEAAIKSRKDSTA